MEQWPKEGRDYLYFEDMSFICPDFDDACFEENRADCENGKTLPLIGICPF